MSSLRTWQRSSSVCVGASMLGARASGGTCIPSYTLGEPSPVNAVRVLTGLDRRSTLGHQPELAHEEAHLLKCLRSTHRPSAPSAHCGAPHGAPASKPDDPHCFRDTPEDLYRPCAIEQHSCSNARVALSTNCLYLLLATDPPALQTHFASFQNREGSETQLF